jgi:hypothetical protein
VSHPPCGHQGGKPCLREEDFYWAVLISFVSSDVYRAQPWCFASVPLSLVLCPLCVQGGKPCLREEDFYWAVVQCGVEAYAHVPMMEDYEKVRTLHRHRHHHRHHGWGQGPSPCLRDGISV